MFLQKLCIEGFKSFATPFEVEFAKGLNVIVGENGVGKSALIDAVRLVLHEDESARAGIDDTTFHCEFCENAVRAQSISVSAQFADLSKDEQVAFMPWSDLNGNASLSLRIEGPPTKRNRYKRILWGGASKNTIFEWELMDRVNCVYIPPLRDAESRLREGRGSRLARLLKNMNSSLLKDESQHPLVAEVTKLNKKLVEEKDYSIAEASQRIGAQLKAAVGSVFGQETSIQFAEANFNRIVEGLRLLFFPLLDANPSTDLFRTLNENSLGYNNLLYLATILAELAPDNGGAGDQEHLKILLIEEPEAHLHPQLQTRLLKFLEGKAKEDGIQVVVSTHSPVLASAVSINCIIHLSQSGNGPAVIRVDKCGIPDVSKAFISRWLDATKSTLLFAKGVILVEGIAEALLLPELARRTITECKFRQLPPSLVDAGVSVINMSGIYFGHFMQLFCNLQEGKASSLPVRCAGITDNDPPGPTYPTPSKTVKGDNPALGLIETAKTSSCGRIYAGSLKTFEYDLAMECANLTIMLRVLSQVWPSEDGTVYPELCKLAEHCWANENDEGVKSDAARKLLERIQDPQIGKGFYAQALAQELASDKTAEFAVPQYIRNAVLWSLGVCDEEIG